MRISILGLLITTSLLVACGDESKQVAAWVEYDTELTYVDTGDETLTVSHELNEAPEVSPIADRIVCGALDATQSTFTLVTVAGDSVDESGQLTATLLVNGIETPLFSWSGALVGGSKSITFNQSSLNLSSAGSQVLDAAVLSAERSYQIRYHFQTDSPVELAQFRVVHRVIVGTTDDSCATSSQ